jgi:hypothetical protein
VKVGFRSGESSEQIIRFIKQLIGHLTFCHRL